MSDSLLMGRYIRIYESYPQYEQPQILRGMRHRLPLDLAYRFGPYLQWSGNITYTELWTDRHLQIRNGQLDTVQGFYRGNYLQARTGLQTTLYGVFYFRRGQLRGLRHITRPQIFYQWTQGNLQPIEWNQRYYSPMALNPLGSVPMQSQQVIQFQWFNRLESKWLKDSTYVRKTLIDELSVRAGWSPTDSFHWQPLLATLRSSQMAGLALLFRAQWTPYWMDSLGRLRPTLLYHQSNRWLQLMTANMSLSWRIPVPEWKPDIQQIEGLAGLPEPYITYTLDIRRLRPDSLAWQQGLQISARWTLTRHWTIRLSTGYDFLQKQFSYTRIEVERDLHCWVLNFSVVPTGFWRSYMITLRPKAGILSDIRLRKQRSWYEQTP